MSQAALRAEPLKMKRFSGPPLQKFYLYHFDKILKIFLKIFGKIIDPYYNYLFSNRI